MDTHNYYMDYALKEAAKAAVKDEVPIGALVVSDSGRIISAAHNLTISSTDPSAHAEILALRKASKQINNYRLVGATMYVTIEPCMMCMGALVHSRIKRLVFGAADPKWGAAGSLFDFSNDPRLNHALDTISGVRQEECRAIIQSFFRHKRLISKKRRKSVGK